MCIRDRARNEPAANTPVKMRACGIPSSATMPRSSVAARSTVSYTHLRAHETELELVCRLLLENKTEKNIAEDSLVGEKRC